MGPFSGSGSTRETKTNSERQSETCSLVLLVLGCVQACFRPRDAHSSKLGRTAGRARVCTGAAGRQTLGWMRGNASKRPGQARASRQAGCWGRADVHACRGRLGRTVARECAVTGAGARSDGRAGTIRRQMCASGCAQVSPSVWTGRLVTGALFTRKHELNLK
ncbi:hypothetical protein CRG98_040672 [Punica granatum]|uniref:Uncharacterized protein n=1 Tax=Punica granatum TaxID=22663 RepID=A0A2I0I5J3_PUNGR|nr:hypothetical protein CRG98_040672 [Punica granatum]